MRFLLTAVAILVLVLPGTARALDITRVTSPGGLEAWLVEDHRNPILTLRFSFRGGESSDPVGKEGRARMVASLLDEGAGDLDSSAFQTALADNSITLRFNSRADRFGGRLVTLTETRDTAVDLLRLALTAPRFDAEPVARIRAQIEASLRRDLQNPRAITGRAWWAANFPDHPYGRPGDGTLDGVAAITRDDLTGFVADTLTRDALIVTAVGDITPEQLGTLVDQAFGALPEVSGAASVEDRVPAISGETIVVETDIPQSQVIFGQPGLSRDDPDWYAASLLNRVMAGGFGSRLTTEIREKRGLVYGVWAYLLPLDHAPLMMGGLATQNARVAESVELVRQEWARMAAEGPTQAELDTARTYTLGSFPLNLTDSDGVAGILMSMRENGLPIDYLDNRREAFEAVTLEEARRVAARLYKPEALTVVVVGKPAGIEATLPPPGG